MVILSLFDGMSCGQIALERAGIKVNKYYASEIDKYAQIVSKANYPDTIYLGDITKWREWDIKKPDIIIGGSPCQGFSFAGKRLNLDDPRSKLFFEFRDIVKHYDPKYFLLENVRMDKESENVISREMGIQPTLINSALVSAQNRNRLYWTNINAVKDLFGDMLPGIGQPRDKKIYLNDIIENAITDREKSHCIDASYFKGGDLKNYFEKSRRQLVFKAANGKNIEIPKNTNFPFMLTEARTEEGKHSRREAKKEHGRDTTKRSKEHKKYIPNNINKSNCILTSNGEMLSQIFINESNYRKLTPIECERLQTVPDNYTNHVSNSQRYKMLGNGWTVDIIVHQLKYLNNNRKM